MQNRRVRLRAPRLMCAGYAPPRGAVAALWGALSLTLGIAGCASDEPPRSTREMLAHAAVAVDVATTRDMREHAAPELAIAGEKLAAARQAARTGDVLEADRLIAETLVNIELAKAKTEAARVAAELARQGGNVAQTPADANAPSRSR